MRALVDANGATGFASFNRLRALSPPLDSAIESAINDFVRAANVAQKIVFGVIEQASAGEITRADGDMAEHAVSVAKDMALEAARAFYGDKHNVAALGCISL